MSSFLDLPYEIILKVLNYTEIIDILRCGQVSKRIRTISNDKSLFQIVNLSGKYVTTDFLVTVLNKGCESLDISNCSLWGNLSLIKKSQLRKLNLSNYEETVEDFLESCHSLEILFLKGLKVTPKEVTSVCQNSQTLQHLNLNRFYFEGDGYKEIIKTYLDQGYMIESMICSVSVQFVRNWLFPKQIKNTGGPPLTRFPLLGIPLPRFVAYVLAKGGFLR
jgi:hypothetical protein